MFKGEEVVEIPSGIADEQVRAKVEEVLGDLGRVRVDKRGEITIEPKAKFKSFFTDVTMSGQLSKRKDGYELTVNYDCNPSVANWIIAVAGTLFLCIGFLAIFIPMTAKDGVGKAIRNALGDLEDSFGGRAS